MAPPRHAGSLRVWVGGACRAVAARSIREIVRLPLLVHVPLGPAYLLGLMNLRGAVVPVLDLARLLDGPGMAATAQSRILVDAAGIGFMVDRVDGLSATADDATPWLDLERLLADAGGAAHRQAPQRRAASALAAAGSGPAAADDAVSLLGFAVADREFAFALRSVQAVAAPSPEEIAAGSMAWRGQPLPLYSLREWLGAPPAAADAVPKPRMAVVRLANGTCAGMLADRFTDILRVPAARRHAVPPLLARGRRTGDGPPEVESICRLAGDRLVCVLSPERLLGQAAAAAPAAAQGGHAAPTGNAAQGAQRRLLIYRVGAGRYAAPLSGIAQLLRLDAPLLPVPGCPAAVEGARNLRGQLLPVIDVGRQFGGAATGAAAGARILVHRGGGETGETGRIGFIVAAVEGIVAAAADQLVPAPAVLESAAPLVAEVLRPAGHAPLVPVLDLPRLLDAGQAAMVAALLAALPARAREPAGVPVAP